MISYEQSNCCTSVRWCLATQYGGCHLWINLEGRGAGCKVQANYFHDFRNHSQWYFQLMRMYKNNYMLIFFLLLTCAVLNDKLKYIHPPSNHIFNAKQKCQRVFLGFVLVWFFKAYYSMPSCVGIIQDFPHLKPRPCKIELQDFSIVQSLIQ